MCRYEYCCFFVVNSVFFVSSYIHRIIVGLGPRTTRTNGSISIGFICIVVFFFLVEIGLYYSSIISSTCSFSSNRGGIKTLRSTRYYSLPVDVVRDGLDDDCIFRMKRNHQSQGGVPFHPLPWHPTSVHISSRQPSKNVQFS